jgi:hypothetical protein
MIERFSSRKKNNKLPSNQSLIILRNTYQGMIYKAAHAGQLLENQEFDREVGCRHSSSSWIGFIEVEKSQT